VKKGFILKRYDQKSNEGSPINDDIMLKLIKK